MKTKIAAIRESKGLSLAQVAIAAGTTKSQVQKLEAGSRRLTADWMLRFSKALGVPVIDLLPHSTHTARRATDDALYELLQLLQDKDKKILLRIARRLLADTDD